MGCCGKSKQVKVFLEQVKNYKKGDLVMRPTCIKCALKHISQARILLLEKDKGYPEHYWFAMGHLAEAEDELVKDKPVEAHTIRDERLKLEKDRSYQIDFVNLIQKLVKALNET